MSENEKRSRIPALSKIQCGSRSPTSQLRTKETRIARKDEFERLARGRKERPENIERQKDRSQCPKYEEKCDHAAWKSDAESSFLTAEFKML